MGNKVLISYFSPTGNTAKMAEAVASGAKNAGAEVRLKDVKVTSLDDLKWADGIVIGSPTYYGQMAAEVKRLFDRSSDIRGQLEDKIGAAFTSSASIEGGNQTTLISILQAMLIHSLIIVGDPMESGGHYGVIAIGEPNKDSLAACRKLGARVAKLAMKLGR
ncbi:MAG: NAD(P)H-dependent oxidoreductase [Methanotrichaceae archaeon]|nr:NAD(P)H-dependent oxidoreductase [Methanotrichaceae archaeon]